MVKDSKDKEILEEKDEELEDNLEEDPEDSDEDLEDDSDDDSDDSDDDEEDDEDSDEDEDGEDQFTSVAEALKSKEGLKAIKAAEDRVRTKLYRDKIKPLESEVKRLKDKLKEAGVDSDDSEAAKELRELRREVAAGKLERIREKAIAESKGRIIAELVTGDTEDEIMDSIASAKSAYKKTYSEILTRLKAEGWEKQGSDRSKRLPGKKTDDVKKKEVRSKFGLDRMRRVPR